MRTAAARTTRLQVDAVSPSKVLEDNGSPTTVRRCPTPSTHRLARQPARRESGKTRFSLSHDREIAALAF